MQKNNSSSHSFGGLIRKVVAPLAVGAACLMPMSKASGDTISFVPDFPTGIFTKHPSLVHDAAASEGYDLMDKVYTFPGTGATIDSYSVNGELKLLTDARPLTSETPYTLIMKGRNLPEGEITSGNISFDIYSPSAFGDKDLIADIRKYNTTTNTLEDEFWVNIREYYDPDNNLDTPPMQIPVSFNGNNTQYVIDVYVPEPKTSTLLVIAGLAGAAAYSVSRQIRKK